MGRWLFCRNKGFFVLYVQKYKLGDTVDVNCTSKESKPAADLTWYINRQPVVSCSNIAWFGIGEERRYMYAKLKRGGFYLRGFPFASPMAWLCSAVKLQIQNLGDFPRSERD